MKKETKVLSADEYFDANFAMHYKGSEGSLKQEVTDFAKDYANYLNQSKLNEVTDDVITEQFPIQGDFNNAISDSQQTGMRIGARWLLEHLKKN